MADSIPQLKKDINDLQVKLAVANSRIAYLESLPERIVEVKVPMPPEVVIEYRDRIVDAATDGSEKKRADALASELSAARSEIETLKTELSAATKPSAEIEYVTEYIPVEKITEVIRYKDNPAHLAIVDQLRDDISAIKSELEAEKAKPPVIKYVDKEVLVPVAMPSETVVQYRDKIVEVPCQHKYDDAYVSGLLIELDELKSELSKLQSDLDAEKSKPAIINTVEKEIVKYVAMPPETVIETRISEVQVTDHSAKKMCEALSLELDAAKAEIETLKASLLSATKKDSDVKTVVEYITIDKPIEVVRYKDNPAHIEMAEKMKADLDECRMQLNDDLKSKAQDKEQIVKYVDNPDLIETIKKLQEKLRGMDQ